VLGPAGPGVVGPAGPAGPGVLGPRGPGVVGPDLPRGPGVLPPPPPGFGGTTSPGPLYCPPCGEIEYSVAFRLEVKLVRTLPSSNAKLNTDINFIFFSFCQFIIEQSPIIVYTIRVADFRDSKHFVERKGEMTWETFIG